MKKFIISTGVLKPVLTKLSQAIAKSTTLPVIQNLYCKVNDQEVTFITTDLELTILYKCEAETAGEPFEMLIPFDFLQKIVALNKTLPLEIEMKGKKGFIHGDNDTYELGVLDKVEEYPKLPEMPKQNFITMGHPFIQWLSKGLIAISKDELRPALNKICLDIKKDKLIMAATDAHILFTRTFVVESKTEDQLLISSKIASSLSGFDETKIYWRKSHIGFECSNMTIIATRHEEAYPNYSAIIPAYEKNLLIEKDLFEQALEKCSLNSEPLKQTTLFLKKKNGNISLEAHDQTLNRKIDVDIEGAYTGELDKIIISAKSFLSLLTQVQAGSINLAFHSTNKAILLTTDNDPDYLGLIMPIFE